MFKKIVAVALTAMMAFGFAACGNAERTTEQNQDGISDDIRNENEFGKLELLKHDGELSQEQVLSRIKAKRLIENDGYVDDDEVTVMITLAGNSLIDSYLGGANLSYKTVADYAASAAGAVETQSIAAKQNALLAELNAKGLINSVEYTYKTVTNAVAVKTYYGNLAKIGELGRVKGIVLADTFNRPRAIGVGDVNSIVNNVDVYDTGIFNSGTLPEFTGDGTAVAVLDSGFDCSHSVFQNSNILNPMYTPSNLVAKVANPELNAAQTTKGLEVSDVYYSDKIPFKYDYADKDSDVFPYDSEHGTHVAGIIGGKDEVITGVAVNTQLVLMKVFPDLREGAETDDILAALEDAVILGVDAVNMSLGSSCGFAREADNDWMNEVYDALEASGISVITAASNSYSSGYGGAQGNTNMVTNPDSGTVGSPSTYDACVSVASISGVKSRYLIGNGEQVLFFNESNNNAGKANDFVKELGIGAGESKEYEYVTVPGVGLATSYSGIKEQIKGKIALIRRGSNTFEEKAQIAKEFGAVACIIYNNIDGEILMSMGKSDHIPTISISKDDGVKLAAKARGTLKIGYDQQAGPFMSDFSSWGPTPSLGIKPEITAHGGNIKSSVPGGGYDELSGTSMASPNLCGIVVLIRQYLKNKYPGLSAREYNNLCNQLLMSTATIIKNQEGNPYSPRKQGAGLASLYNAVKTKALIEVEGQDKPKLELNDDPARAGVYTLEFNVKNLSESALDYDVSLIGMTESVSTSDDKHVSEKAYMLGGNVVVSLVSGDATLSGAALTVKGKATAKIKVVYTLSKEDKRYIESSFPYGMYVEGFVKLTAKDENEISLNVPYLAFFGDWTEAPMFDKTFYEVESQAHDGSIDEEDKLKADYFATTPYGSYMYNYIIPLGSYLYDIDKSVYSAIPATEEHAAISDSSGTIDGIFAVYAGLLRGAKEMHFSLTDKITGEVVWELTDYNARKSASNGGSPMPYFESLKLSAAKLGLVNNRQYEFKMQGKLDYGEDGGLSTNVRNTFAFDVYFDNEAPVIKDASYEKVYDRSLKKDRYYLTLTVYDNQYVQSINPVAFSKSSGSLGIAYLLDEPIPVYGAKGADNRVRFEITDFLDGIYSDDLINHALAFSIDDYALNSSIYICTLPGTRGDFRFTSNGTESGRPLTTTTAEVGDVVDLTQYLYSSDATLDGGKDYLKYLKWTCSRTDIIKCDPTTKQLRNGEAVCLKAGTVTITVSEMVNDNPKTATITLRVKEKTAAARASVKSAARSVSDAELESVEFIYFDTLFAYSRSAQTSEIEDTGDRVYVSALKSGIRFYPGEKVKLAYDVKPWYIRDDLKVTYSTTDDNIVKVEQDGTVTALKEGSAFVTLNVEGSNIQAIISVTVKNEFVIEGRVLVAYKGLGGDVVIPDDEGILYIGAYAFCLYDTDRSIELTEDDYDANKIPSKNSTITSVVIPEGVSDVQKYAFYNCTNLKEVTLPSSIKFVREYAFYNDAKLTTINLENVEAIGAHAFRGCKQLGNVDLSKCYSLGASAFEGCASLTAVDISHLRNAAEERLANGSLAGRTFKDCIALATVVLGENTKLCREMFVNCALEEIDVYEKINVPAYAFAQNSKLKKVTLHNSLVSIDGGAFGKCPLLKTVDLRGAVQILGPEAFLNTGLEEFVLPDCPVMIGDYCFKGSALKSLTIGENTSIDYLGAAVFGGTPLDTFKVNAGNNDYATDADGALLVTKDKSAVILAATGRELGELTLNASYKVILYGAFAGAKLTSLTIENNEVAIGDYAFGECVQLREVIFPAGLTADAYVGRRAFNGCTALAAIQNSDKLKQVDEYAFANTGLGTITLGEGALFGEGAFFQSKATEVTIGANSEFGLGAFQNCAFLQIVNMPAAGGVHIGADGFAGCVSLKAFDASKTDGVIEAETFYGCTSLASVNLAGVTQIGEYAFGDCGALTSVASANGVKVIGEGAFSRVSARGKAPSFSSIQLDSIETLGSGAFLGNQGLTSITLPNTLTAIGDFAFALCANLQTATLADSVAEIGAYAFRGCERLVSINTDKVKIFGENSFYGAVGLTSIELGSAEVIGDGAFAGSSISNGVTANNLISVGNDAFSKTDLTSFTAPKLESIGVGAFYKNAKLTEFVFGEDIEFVGSMAFLGCDSLSSFAFGAARAKSGDINGYASLDGGVLYVKLLSGKIELKAVPAALDVETLTVKEGTARIDLYAGNRNANVKKIVLPDSLRLVGNYAFNGYANLEEVEFRSFAAPALESEFYSMNGEEANFPAAKLLADAPGYGLLHNQLDVYENELSYFNFKALAGSFSSIKMTLPSNGGSGYGGIIYEAYFGKVSSAARSEYVAMDAATSAFIEYANKVAAIENVVLSDERVINNAVTALNSLKQNLTDYGYAQTEADALVKAVRDAKSKLTELQIAAAGKDFKNIRAKINELPAQFDISRLELMREIYGEINALRTEEQILLRETDEYAKFAALSAGYDEYCKTVKEEGDEARAAAISAFAYSAAAAIAATASVLSAAAFLAKRRLGL